MVAPGWQPGLRTEGGLVEGARAREEGERAAELFLTCQPSPKFRKGCVLDLGEVGMGGKVSFLDVCFVHIAEQV